MALQTSPATSSYTDALVLKDVTKRFGDFVAVDNLSLNIPKGSIYGFLGPNGAGKTTTIRMVMSIFYPDEGEISVLGHPNAESVKDRLGYLPEEKGLYKKMKTAEIVAYFGKLKGMDRSTANLKAREMLTQYGLGDWLDKKCETMSKGMGQKVQLLGTMIHEPELVILDEPFSGLDPVNMEVMRDTIRSFKQDNRTVIFSTHVMAQAEELCDYIFLINKGKKVLDGPLREIKTTGDHSVKIDYDGDDSVLHQLSGVTRVNDAGKSAEVFLDSTRDPQDVLAELVGKITIRKFDLSEPSLHEVFLRAVGGDSDE
ncbi:MAG: ATP-binding cassette domain-containing protein [Planctomycetota bacterium]|nr:ATP-binding cassette domain-containing protein [Planctomycetota bacterium]